ncbi:HTTM domain-containing protein [Rubripirellula tenax]|nr:HTTM domain-containing protein [Rubripirellula tenax]
MTDSLIQLQPQQSTNVPSRPTTIWHRVSTSGFDRVDSLILIWLRVAVAVAIYVWANDYLADETYRHVFIEPRVLMKYAEFEWVLLWPGDGMYWHFVITKIAAICLAAGLVTRLSAAILCFSIAYVLLVEATIYVNHYYLLSMTAGLLVFLPAAGQWSVDRLIGLTRTGPTMWRWQLWMLRFQLGMPYVFGAMAKLNGDWLRGQPMESILRLRTSWGGRPWSEIPGMVEAFAWGGFAFDLLVVPLLMWKRTRLIAVVWAMLFHLTNAATLDIGVFPWFMLATLVVFFPVDFLRRRMRMFVGDTRDLIPHSDVATLVSRLDRVAATMAIVYVFIHICLPMRPAIYPGDSNWNERGHRFAWRMMLYHKHALTHYLVVDKNSDEFLFVPSTTVLTGYQALRDDHRPEMIRQTAVAISRTATELGVTENRVYALALVSLNGRKPTPIVDPTIDLTQVRQGWWRDDWVRQDPGPLSDPPWTIDKEQWWSVLELPEPFTALQGRTPNELQEFLKQQATKKATP